LSRALGVVLASAMACAVAGCGSSSDGSAGSGDGQVIVSAASSLEPAFTAYADEAGIDAKQSFAGSDDLAAQIRQGVRPDVYAAADISLPAGLHADGLVAKPVPFATNTLVVGVPSGSAISSLGDLAAPGTKIAIGDIGVPAGDYAREVIARLPEAESAAILGNVRSKEPDVSGIAGKITQGAVDAGFVYITDVRASGGALEAVPIPPRLQPQVTYGVAAVNDDPNPEGARAFIAGLLHGDGAGALRAAGFGPPPG
jgi:molybdate transport system substrate-binding protein